MVEEEALALITTVRVYFRFQLMTVYTDHRPLDFFQKIKSHNAKLLRWSVELDQYALLIRHRLAKTIYCQTYWVTLRQLDLGCQTWLLEDAMLVDGVGIPYSTLVAISQSCPQLDSNDCRSPLKGPGGMLYTCCCIEFHNFLSVRWR